MSRIDEVIGKGTCRICLECGDVKIWDYANERKCPLNNRHKWRHIDYDKLSEDERNSIDEQVKRDANHAISEPEVKGGKNE